ncbi:MAG: peptidyl-alpha-hydroxyglycine alpha-amidating lyase family protein [Thaumarchaeota archaeon]|nr:peptidyl-alpha-hydroxyglycine alpha-amidating lyase family protein [Nitrososphaerota archaeon]
MNEQVDSGERKWSINSAWGDLPLWWRFGNASDLATDSKGRVFVLDRGAHPVLVFDRNGGFISSWGDGLFRYPHGLYIDRRDNVYVADSYTHLVWKFTLDGKLVRTWGNKDVPSPVHNGFPFNMPTGVTVGPSGCMYVSDGYGNSRVQKFAPDGTFLKSWGRPGNGPGEFDTVHSIDVDEDERVYVCDRDNRRVQVFDQDGKFLSEWGGLSMASGVRVRDGLVYVAEEGNHQNWSGLGLDLQPCVSVFSREGKLLSRWKNGEQGCKNMVEAHGLTVDGEGNVYVAQVYWDTRVFKFTKQ